MLLQKLEHFVMNPVEFSQQPNAANHKKSRKLLATWTSRDFEHEGGKVGDPATVLAVPFLLQHWCIIIIEDVRASSD